MTRSRSFVTTGLLAIVLVAAGCPAPRRPAGVRATTHAPPPPSTSAPILEPDAGAVAEAPPLPVVLGPFGGERHRRDPSDLCEPARENLERAARAIVNDHRTDAPSPARPWDHVTPPKFTKLVGDRYALTSAEKALLAKNGFVVPARLATRGYADALHDLYQSQLPIYVSADAVLHAIFKSNDAILQTSELELMPKLDTMLERMHDTLAKVKADYPAEVARDADVYLTVARSLLAEAPVGSKLGTDAEVAPLLEGARRANGLVSITLFGRARMVDWSQYGPRGHYAKSEELSRWFRASMWLSRLELNLVSRASRSSQPGITPTPEETPREAVVALALADLAERADALGTLDAIDAAWTQFAGRREDVPMRALLAMKKQAGITKLSVPDSAEKLKAQIGSGYQRTARMHYMPQGSTPLPAIATMFGPRVVVDTQAETELVHAHVDGRAKPSFADVAFMLGHDRAKTWLAPELAHHPDLGAKLEKGRALIAATAPTDLYAAWLASIRGLAATPAGTVPSFMKTDAFRDLRVNSTVAAYGQLRHNYVLVAGQAYDEGGCEVPDGWVEPALETYEALLAYARRGSEAMTAIGAAEESKKYFERLEKTMGVLVAITKDELAGRALSEEEKRWLSMVVEIVPPSSDGPGSFDGWYFDLFPTIGEAFTEHEFVADWFTSSNANAVVYAGATAPRLGLFVVDTGGEPRIMVGPVARAYEHVAPLDRRLTDADVPKLRNLREPWAASYTAPAAPMPPLLVLSLTSGATDRSFAVRSTRALGPVTIELLGHHREILGRATASVGPGYSVVKVKQKEDAYAEIVRLRYGEASHEIRATFGDVAEGIGGIQVPDWEAVFKLREKLGPRE